MAQGGQFSVARDTGEAAEVTTGITAGVTTGVATGEAAGATAGVGFVASLGLNLSLKFYEVLLHLSEIVVRSEALLCGGSPQGVTGARATTNGSRVHRLRGGAPEVRGLG
jgi:hypothetical protein